MRRLVLEGMVLVAFAATLAYIILDYGIDWIVRRGMKAAGISL